MWISKIIILPFGQNLEEADIQTEPFPSSEETIFCVCFGVMLLSAELQMEPLVALYYFLPQNRYT